MYQKEMQIHDLCLRVKKKVNEIKTLLNKFDWPRLIDT